jgi:hypothetical protein
VTVVHATDHWLVTTAPEPLPGTLHHWVLTPRIGRPRDLTMLWPGAKAEFWEVLDWLRSRYRLTYWCMGVRSWEDGLVHVVVADGTPADPVRFDLSRPGSLAG